MMTFEPFRIFCLKNRKGRKDVIAETGLGSTTVHRIFNDSHPVLTDTLETLCKTYNLKIDEVIEFRED